ncbi:MAG TPA: PHB depolymerase family esterase [Mycobacteriales bacterium]|nr:PHB depolymerase family esterase [Mycobacteriales bacterium]
MCPLRRAAAAAAVAVLAAGLPVHAAAGKPKGATFSRHTYPEAGAPGARDYWLYVPAGRAVRPRPLVMFLHGCNETAVQAAAATHLNKLAARRGFVAVYPQQRVTENSSAPADDGNGVGCWNWFLPENQARGSGEPATLAGLTSYLVRTMHLDPRRVYVAGASAGADMAVILAATYPDRYAAVAAIAGCAFATCGDESGQLTYEAMGTRARVVPLFVENGSADTLNNLGMAGGLVQSWLGASDLTDDGSANGSIARTPAETANYYFDQTPQPGSGDVCAHNNSLTCPGGAVGFQDNYPTTVTRYADGSGCTVVEFWVLHGMQHAHPDAPGDGPYTDPLGPDITTASYDFFADHPLGGRCRR